MILAFLLGNPIGRVVSGFLAGSLVILASYAVGYGRGYDKADRAAELAALRGSLAVAYQERDAQRVATDLAQKAADANSKAADAAAERIADYETELARRGESAACLLGDSDLKFLIQRGPK